MDRSAAYRLLADELLSWQLRPYVELAAVVNSPPQTRDVRVNDETVQLEVRLSWKDSPLQAIEVRAVILGSSCWQLERCEERIVVSPPAYQLLRTRKQRAAEEDVKWDLAANIEWYCETWRQFFPVVAGWDKRRTEEFIEWMKEKKQEEGTQIFHEEPFTWSVWAALPHREGMSPEPVVQAQNELINFIIKHKNSRGGSYDAIDWEIVGDVYRELQSELEQLTTN